jgi:hypothetical protein
VDSPPLPLLATRTKQNHLAFAFSYCYISILLSPLTIRRNQPRRLLNGRSLRETRRQPDHEFIPQAGASPQSSSTNGSFFAGHFAHSCYKLFLSFATSK